MWNPLVVTQHATLQHINWISRTRRPLEAIQDQDTALRAHFSDNPGATHDISELGYLHRFMIPSGVGFFHCTMF